MIGASSEVVIKRASVIVAIKQRALFSSDTSTRNEYRLDLARGLTVFPTIIDSTEIRPKSTVRSELAGTTVEDLASFLLSAFMSRVVCKTTLAPPSSSAYEWKYEISDHKT